MLEQLSVEKNNKFVDLIIMIENLIETDFNFAISLTDKFTEKFEKFQG